MTRNELEKKWNDIENGKIPDDYQNPFLSHFGFWDRPLNQEEQRQRRRNHASGKY